VSKEQSFCCPICNVTIFSNHCYISHKRFCTKSGNFGYFCSECKKFTYRQGKTNSFSIKSSHICGTLKPCKTCFTQIKENETHQCTLKKETYPFEWPRLGFIIFHEFSNNDHLAPFIAMVYREEEKRGLFCKYIMSEPFLTIADEKEENHLYFKYFKNEVKFTNSKKKVTDDFNINLDL
jgi:hypothetical protein